MDASPYPTLADSAAALADALDAWNMDTLSTIIAPGGDWQVPGDSMLLDTYTLSGIHSKVPHSRVLILSQAGGIALASIIAADDHLTAIPSTVLAKAAGMDPGQITELRDALGSPAALCTLLEVLSPDEDDIIGAIAVRSLMLSPDLIPVALAEVGDTVLAGNGCVVVRV